MDATAAPPSERIEPLLASASASSEAPTTGASPSSSTPAPTPAPSPPPRPPAVSFTSLFRFADAYDGFLFALILLCAAGTGVIIPLLSLILGKLLNGASSQSPSPSSSSSSSAPTIGEDVVNTAALYMTLLAIAAFITLGGGIYLAFVSAQRQVHKLRLAYLRALLRQDLGYADTHSLPEQAARLTEDTLTVQAGLGDKLFLILTGLAQFVGSLVLAFSVASQAWRLALTLLVTLPVAVGAVGFLFTFVTSLSGESDDAYARAGEVLSESLAMVRTVAALGGEEHEAARYDVHLASAERVGRKKGLVSGVGQGIFVGVMCSVYAIGLYAGARFIAVNRADYPECYANPDASYSCFSGGTVIQVLFGVIGGAFSLGIVAPNIAYVGSAQAAAARMYAVIDARPAVDPFSDAGIVPAGQAKGRIEFRNVTFAYPSRPDEVVLKDFSLVIEPGQKVAFVGPSGSGKSTVVALLQRWYEPLEGQILLDGVELKDYNVRWLRAQQALVGQEPQMLPMSIRANIAAGVPAPVPRDRSAGAGAVDGKGAGDGVVVVAVTPDDAAVEAAARAADAHAFISTLPKGYDTLVTSAQLSGGQKQRVCIARAIIRKAPILLLDEATSALDSRSEKTVQAAIDRLLEGASASSSSSPSRFTSISIAHRLSTITGSDVIVVIEKGRLVERGTHAELVAKGLEGSLYARLWAIQSQGRKSGTGSAVEDKGELNSSSAPSSAASSSSTTNAGPESKGAALTVRSPLWVAKEAANSEEDEDDAVGVVTKPSKSSPSSASPSFSSSWAPVPRVPYRKAWEYQAPESGWVVFGVLLAAINGLLLPAFAFLLTKFIVIFYEPDTDAMVAQATVYLAIFFGIAAVCFFLNILQGYAFASAGEPFVRRLRRAAFSSIIAQSIGFLELPANSPGQLSARLGLDATKMKLSLGPRLGEKVSALSTLVAGVALALWASWQLTLIVVLIGPLVVYAADAENQVTFSSTDAVKQAYAEAGAVASDAVAAIRVVHSFGLQSVTLERFETALGTPFREGYRRAMGLGVGFGSNQCLQNLVAAVVFKAGLVLQVQDVVTAEDIFLVFFAFQFACFGLPQLTALLSDAAGIRDALRSFFSMILRSSDIDGRETTAEAWRKEVEGGGKAGPADEKDKDEDEDPLAASRLAVPEGRIEFRDVTFAYPTRPEAEVLRGLTLSIAPGQTVALVGPSGGGKSSVVALLLRLYDPTSGQILLDGRDIKALPARAVRDATGWVGQEAPLFAESVAYNIAYGRAGGARLKPRPEEGMPREAAPDAPMPPNFVVPEDVAAAATQANAAGFIAGFRHGYATHVGDGGRGVSGGQKQRLACARAIVRKGGNLRLLLLDEATSALDSESEKVVQESIDALLMEQGGKVTTVIIAHRLSTIVHSDLIAVIDRGRVVEQGTFEELMRAQAGGDGGGSGLFRKLAEAQGFGVGAAKKGE